MRPAVARDLLAGEHGDRDRGLVPTDEQLEATVDGGIGRLLGVDAGARERHDAAIRVGLIEPGRDLARAADGEHGEEEKGPGAHDSKGESTVPRAVCQASSARIRICRRPDRFTGTKYPRSHRVSKGDHGVAGTSLRPSPRRPSLAGAPARDDVSDATSNGDVGAFDQTKILGYLE